MKRWVTRGSRRLDRGPPPRSSRRDPLYIWLRLALLCPELRERLWRVVGASGDLQTAMDGFAADIVALNELLGEQHAHEEDERRTAAQAITPSTLGSAAGIPQGECIFLAR